MSKFTVNPEKIRLIEEIMPKQIVSWITKDGRQFNSLEEANLHETSVQLFYFFQKHIREPDSDYIEIVINAILENYSEILDILTTNKINKRSV